MADTISLHLDIQNNLLKTLKQTEVTMKSFNSLLEKSGKSFDKVGKNTQNIADHYDDIDKNQKKIIKSTETWNKGLGHVSGTLKHLIPGFLEIFTGSAILNSVKHVMSLDKEMKDLSFRMGDAGKSTEMLKGSVFGVVQATGASVDEAASLVKQLKQLRVPNQYMSELATNTTLYSQVTGVSAEAAGNLTGELTRIGRLGPKATTDILAGMVKVQRAVGMTNGEMEQLNDGLIQSTQVLGQMGKNAAQIESFNKGVMKLAAGFTAVGLSAQDANKFVGELLDPSRVQDNAFLYAKLGISLQDAFSGNVDMNKVASGFKNLGQQMKSMTGPAAAAMAQQLGYSVRDLRQMADMPIDKLNKVLQGGKNGATDLSKAQGQQASAQDKFERGVNKLSGAMDNLMNKYLMPAINTISNIFKTITDFFGKNPLKAALLGAILLAIVAVIKLKKKFFSVATDTKKAIKTAIIEGFDQGSRAGAAKMMKNVNASQIDRQARVQAGPQYGAMQGKADYFKALSGGNVFKVVAKMNTTTAEWLQKISSGARPVAKIVTLTNEYNKRIKERLDFMHQEESVRKELNKDQREELKDTHQLLISRRDYLMETKRTAEQNWELNKITKEISKNERQFAKLRGESNQQETRFRGLEEKYIRRLSETQIRSMKTELQGQIDIRNTEIQGATEKRTGLQASLKLINAELKNTKLTYFERKKLTEEQSSLNSELSQQNDLIGMARKETKKYENQIADINKIYKKDVGVGPGASTMFTSRLQKVANYVSARFHDAGAGLFKTFDKIKESARQIGKNLAERLNPRNIGANLRRRFLTPEGRQEAKQNRESKKSNLKMFGVLGLIGGFLLRSEPIQKLLKNTMDKIQPLLNGLVNTLVPIFQNLLTALTPFIQTVIKTLTPVISVFADIFAKIGGILLDVLIKIAKALMPAIIRIFSALLPIFAILVNKLLPPLIMVLGYVLKAVGGLVKTLIKAAYTIAHPFMNGEKRDAMIKNDPFYKISEAVADAGTQLVDTGKDLWTNQVISNTQVKDLQKKLNQAADNISNSSFGDPAKTENAITKGVEKGIAKTTINPAEISAQQSGLVVKHGISTSATMGTISGQQTAGATQSVAESSQKTSEAVSVMYQEQKDQQNKLLAEQGQTNQLLRQLIGTIQAKM